MKKIIVIEIIVLALLLVVLGAFTLKELAPADASTTEPLDIQPLQDVQALPTERAEPTQEPTEEPTQEPTLPPETEPPIVVELEENWITVLQDHELTAAQYFVYDCDTASFLTISGDATEKVYPASVTKLFSAYVALQYIDPEQEVIAGGSLSLIDPDSSTAGLQQGDTLTAQEMVAGMLLCSGNDATYALVSDVGRIIANNQDLDTASAIEQFVDEMNNCANMLGMENSHFVTPDGIHDEEHYVSMEDLIIVSRLAMNDPILSQYIGLADLDVTTKQERSLEWENSNRLLHEDDDYYCSYATGLKTGYTSAAGNCLLSSFQVGDRELLIGVFGCPESSDRYADTLLLFTQTFDLEIPDLPDEEQTQEPTEDSTEDTSYDEAA